MILCARCKTEVDETDEDRELCALCGLPLCRRCWRAHDVCMDCEAKLKKRDQWPD